MANILKTVISGSAQVEVNVTTLGASDTLVYKEGVNATLILNNVTAGALTPLVVGGSATTYPAAGLGNVDTSGGLQLTSIGAGDTFALELDNVKGWLKGVITITGSDGIEAQLLEY